MRGKTSRSLELLKPILAIVLFAFVSVNRTRQGDAAVSLAQSTITVANLNDSGPGSLRDAIANAAPGGVITIPGPGGTISLNSSLLIDKNLTINGPGAGALTISGLTASGSKVRIFFIRQGLVTISAMTIANGGVKGGDGGTGGAGGGGGAGMGGGVFINSGFVTLVDVAFSGNSAAGGNGGTTGYAPAGGGGGGGFSDGTAGNPGMHADSDGNGGAGAAGASFGTPAPPRGDRGEDDPCSQAPDAPSATSDGTGGSGAGRVGFDFGGDCILGGSGLLATITDLPGGKGGAGAFAGGGGAGGGGGGDHVSNNIFGTGGHGSDPNLQTGGSGGFGGGGGGGGGNTNGDVGGFGGAGGQFGGHGAQGSRCRECGGGGGGGAGLGGAIFVKSGALVLNACSFTNDSVSPGTAGAGGLSAPATDGQTAGRAIFAMDTADVGIISTNFNGEDVYPTPTGSTATVTNLNDGGPGSLRDAINSAQLNTTITFQEGLSGTINLSSQSLVVNTSLTIIGPGHDQLTINGGGFARPFFVNGILVKISGMTIENGHAKGGDGGCGGAGGGGAAGMGGGMFINSGNVTLKDVFFTNNSATGGNGGGGAFTCGNGGGGGGGGFGFSGAGANGGNADGDGNSGPGSSGGELGGIAPGRADRGHNAGGFPSTCGPGNDGGSTNTPDGAGAGAAGGGRTGIAANGDCGTGGLGGNAGFGAGGGAGGGGTTDAGATGEQSGGMGGFGGGGGGGGGRTRGDGQPGPGGLAGQFGGNGTPGGLCRECGGGGGGGAGLGGAVFIRAGILILDNCSFNGDSVTAGRGNIGSCAQVCNGQSGQAVGRAVFAVDGATVTQCGSDLHGEDMYSSSGGLLAAPNTNITAPSSVCTNSTGNIASVPDAGAGATYLWSVTDGLLTAGQGTPSITWSALNISPVTINVTVSNAGNCGASGSVSVTVKKPPTAICQNITVALTANNTVTITGPQVDGGSTAECGIASRTVSPDTFNCSNLGPNGVTLTVTDTAGNKSTCTAVVTVVDNTPPVINCPANIVVNTAPGLCSAVVTFPTPIASDNCTPSPAVVCSPPSGSVFNKGVTTVTCTATDASGNKTQCQFTVTVLDKESPTITCPPAITAVTAGPSDTSVVVNFPAPPATDNCPGVTVVCNPPSGSVFPLGTSTVTCTATDTSGNKATCAFLITVFDKCLRDNSTGDYVQINSASGAYLFTHCGPNGLTLSGQGAVRVVAGVLVITDTGSDRRIRISYMLNQFTGTASITQIVATGVYQTFTISDTNPHPTCRCS